MKPELIDALCRCLDFVNHAAGEGIDFYGLDASDIYWEVSDAVGIKPDDFEEHGTLMAKLRSVLSQTLMLSSSSLTEVLCEAFEVSLGGGIWDGVVSGDSVILSFRFNLPRSPNFMRHIR